MRLNETANPYRFRSIIQDRNAAASRHGFDFRVVVESDDGTTRHVDAIHNDRLDALLEAAMAARTHAGSTVTVRVCWNRGSDAYVAHCVDRREWRDNDWHTF